MVRLFIGCKQTKGKLQCWYKPTNKKLSYIGNKKMSTILKALIV